MQSFKFSDLLFNDGWKHNVYVEVDKLGEIVAIEFNSDKTADETIEGLSLPGFQNAHSHAFQYAMAGLAEIHNSSQSDDFWSWRDAMYKLALSISPDDMQAIATMLYSEMARQGYTNVAEFHYVHHDKEGKPYANLSEMGERLIIAAKEVGINITLVPIFYQKGGFGKEPTAGQKRFISKDIETYYELLEASKKSTTLYTGANHAIGIHSMRGVEPTDIAQVASFGPQNLPFHIHVSEQIKEINDSIAYLHQRPVEWLNNNIDLSDRFHLVHATHLTEHETKAIANTGANVVLCPTTEGNLGDGLFPLHEYQKLKGQWSIGTDSHIGINPLEELRLLDYGQRLITHDRKTYAKTNGDSGAFAIDTALKAGRKAMNNFDSKYFAVGSQLNVATYSKKHPLIKTSSIASLTSTLLYTGDATFNSSTIVNGKVIVKEGRHIKAEQIGNEFVRVLKNLGNR